MDKSKDLLVGIVFFAALALLLFMTIALTDFSFQGKQHLEIFFPEANQLKTADPVLVLGTRAGRVKNVTFDNEATSQRRVVVTIQLDKPVALHEGYKMTIEESSLLGGRAVVIDPGKSDAPQVSLDATHLGALVENPIEELAKLVDENRENIREVISGLRTATDNLKEGKGTLGKLFHEEAIYDKIHKAAENLETITQDVRDGKGVLGKLISDDKLSTQLSDFVADASEIANDLRAGKGTLGRLMQDEELAKKFSNFASNLEEISDGIAHGDGTLSKLLHDDALYNNWNKVGDNLGEIAASLKEGKGTLGRLIQDEGLYEEIQQTFRAVNRSIEDAREAAPITTFSSLLFGAF